MARRKPRALLEEPKRIQSGCRARQIARNRWRAIRIKQRCAACVLLHMAPERPRPPTTAATVSIMSPPPYSEEDDEGFHQFHHHPVRGISEVSAAAETTMSSSRKCFDHRTHAQWRWRRRQRRPSEVDRGAPCGCRSSSKEEAECDCCQLAVATARRVATPPPDYYSSIPIDSSELLCHRAQSTRDHDSATFSQRPAAATEGLSYCSTSVSRSAGFDRVQGASPVPSENGRALPRKTRLPPQSHNDSDGKREQQRHCADVVPFADRVQQEEAATNVLASSTAAASDRAAVNAEAASSSARTTARRRNSPSAGRAVSSSPSTAHLTRPPIGATPPQYSDQQHCQYFLEQHYAAAAAADHNFHHNFAREGISAKRQSRAASSRAAVARGDDVKSEVDLSPLYHPQIPCDPTPCVVGSASAELGGGGGGGCGGSGISGGNCCSGGGGALPPRSLLPPGAQTEATLVSATRDQRQRRGGRRAILSQRSRSESDDEGGFCIREVVRLTDSAINGHQIAAAAGATNATDPSFYVEEATAGEEETASTHRPRSTLARLNAGWSSVNRHCRRQNLPPRRARNSAQRVPSDAQGCLDGALPPYASPRRAARAGLSLHYPPPLARSGRFLDPEIETPKHCCAFLVNQTISIRWFILMIAFVGLSCSLVGTVLGTFRTGREHLTIALLMIGVGIVLITVSGVAWRLTAYDSVSSCGTMLGLTTDPHAEPNRRFVNRMPPYGRYNHPYAAMMYPEFHYRPPPPTYQASMQEYRLRLLFDRHQNTTTTAAVGPVSPPPTYRSAQSTLEHTRPHLNQVIVEDYSRPPSYRSRASSSHGGPASMLRSCLGDVARSTDTLATTPPSEIVPNPLASAVEIEKSPRETTGTSDNGTEKDTSARGSDVVKVYVNFAQE